MILCILRLTTIDTTKAPMPTPQATHVRISTLRMVACLVIFMKLAMLITRKTALALKLLREEERNFSIVSFFIFTLYFIVAKCV